MQETQSEGKTSMESTTFDNLNGEFEKGNPTADPDETEMEFVQTHYSPRGVVFLYFEGNSAAEVEKHFNRTFSELCYLPTVEGRPDEAQTFQGFPMSQRNLPPSFWDPSKSLQSSQLVGASRQPAGFMQENDDVSTTLYSNQCYSFGHHGSGEQKGPNFTRSQTVPITFAELPAGAVKSVAPVSVAPCRALPLPRDSAIQHSAPQTPAGFNPCYNAFLVQPEVKPQLPRIPGEPRKPERKGKDPGSGDGFAESILTDGN